VYMIVYMIVYIERLYVMASSAVYFYLQSILTAGRSPHWYIERSSPPSLGGPPLTVNSYGGAKPPLVYRA